MLLLAGKTGLVGPVGAGVAAEEEVGEEGAAMVDTTRPATARGEKSFMVVD